jgi:hypothetical protein
MADFIYGPPAGDLNSPPFGALDKYCLFEKDDYPNYKLGSGAIFSN